MPLGEKPKACRRNRSEGIRQNSPVPLVEGVPAMKMAGLSNKGAPTV